MKIFDGEKSLTTDPGFWTRVREKCGQPLELCYQCQKCTAGCPVAEYGDYAPNQILRLVFYGLKEQALRSRAIWLCSGCETCGARCPNGIKISEVMDVLRALSADQGVPREKQAETFHRLFLREVKTRGRIHEGLFIAKYKLKSGQLFTDLDLGYQFFKKGKFTLLPRSVKNKQQVRNIFTRAEEAQKGGGPA